MSERSARARSVLLIGIVTVALTGGCSSEEGSGGATEPTLTVVASFYPLAEATERVGGDAVEVVTLTPPGVEPHDLELSPDQVEAIQSADVVVFLGGGFQPAVEEAVTEAQGLVLDALSAVETEAPPQGEDDLAVDPHVWLDPERYAALVDRIAAALEDADPTGAPDFAERASAFEQELARLDQGFTSGLATCARRQIVTTHAAFGYLADAYDLEQLAISGLEPDAEPTPERLAELVELVEREGVTTIFTEELVPPDVAETLAAEVGVDTAMLRTLEGAPDDGGDYLSIMHENLETLRRALGCS